MVAMQMLFGLTMFVYSFNSRKFVLKNSLIEFNKVIDSMSTFTI